MKDGAVVLSKTMVLTGARKARKTARTARQGKIRRHGVQGSQFHRGGARDIATCLPFSITT